MVEFLNGCLRSSSNLVKGGLWQRPFNCIKAHFDQWRSDFEKSLLSIHEFGIFSWRSKTETQRSIWKSNRNAQKDIFPRSAAMLFVFTSICLGLQCPSSCHPINNGICIHQSQEQSIFLETDALMVREKRVPFILYLWIYSQHKS